MDGLPLEFKQSQTLELVRNKIRLVILMLESGISTAESVKMHATKHSHHQQHDAKGAAGWENPLELRLRQHIDVLKLHKMKAVGLLESTQSIDALVWQSSL
jgi:Tfp pilus assembly protein PilP